MNEVGEKIAFFGGEPLAVPTLNALHETGIIPDLVVCNPDRPQGRKMVLTPPPVKIWAEEHDISVFQPENYKDPEVRTKLESTPWDLFVVVAYNFILPGWLIELPRQGTINVHPSLLPKLRGASPIRSAILEDMRKTGVSIIKLDEEMDHGPILAQEKIEIAESEWPLPGRELDRRLALLGGTLLAETIPKWLGGKIVPQEQNHEEATYCGKIDKAESELYLDPHELPIGNEAYQTLLKIRAYDGWPGTFFVHDGRRIKIQEAELSHEGQLRLLRITPEGKKEADFEVFLRSL